MFTHSTPRRPGRAAAAIAAAAALALTLSACAGGDAGTSEGGSGSSDGASITFIPKNLNNPYISLELSGAKDAAEELGFTYNEAAALDAGADSQIPFIQTEVQNGTQIIAVSPNDPDAVCPALEDARAGGAKIITFDSDSATECRDLFINQTSVEGVAAGQLEQLYDQIGGTGEIAVLSATAAAPNQNAWIAAMEEQIAENPDYEWDLVTTVYGDDDDTKSFQEAQGLLQSYPDLKGIISPTTVGIAATARYLSTSEYKGKVALVGLGLPGQMKEYIEDGTVTAFALWDPSQVGYLTAFAGKALLDGTITGAEGDTFDAGELGSYTVGEDGLVIVGELLKFDAENIDQYDYISF
ncbi:MULTISPECIES: rhamnose ABC transporter substrate-binding protein [unclassified Rathayibacter]|uniref:rhamnose ABC transporter substrate-binding protein n=1 Tax=unclassified Rathayibacter TaxID=2609250 RepID=UPI000F4C17A1|nr:MULTISPECIES: rhamnose ABC transporter substrate-binding protein [unclassified Rathayibacter]ROP49082.1 monosaccharide ABC transporter substrate-binding protein (CUT2 family) [Rathayibacter sp. PhB186]ROS50801.1 monosaccharide ABC transporter substrate-binding protein (CUT2 family) [Rathayibacter sp. PhB185]